MNHNLNNNDFDIGKFNKAFEEKTKNDKKTALIEQQKKLSKMDKIEHRRLYDYTIAETLIHTKDSIFDILDDMLKFNIKKDIFTKNNRLYYIGISLIIIVIILHTYDLFHETHIN